jgi:DNA-binding CsgD family transcriptional regulator
MDATSARTPFVGRAADLSHLQARLVEARSGVGGVVLVTGEAGIGKSRLAEAVASHAGAEGMRVLWGRCYEGEGAPPCWPWTQVLTALFDGSDSPARPPMLGFDAETLTQIVPELRERLSAASDHSPPSDPAQARFSLFQSITTAIQAAALRQPLLIVLDDLHDADPMSLLLLTFLARKAQGARLLVLGAFRESQRDPTHPLSAALAELARGGAGEVMTIAGLSPAEVGEYLTLTRGSEPPSEVISAIHGRTGGNPLYLIELVRLFEIGGTIPHFTVRLPPSIVDVVTRRLARLSGFCREVLTLAAVIGREFSLGVLVRVEGAESSIVPALAEAQTARLIEGTGAVGHYRFTHGIVWESIYATLDALELSRRHRQVGEAMERLAGLRPEPYLTELSRHFVQAATLGTAKKGVDYARRAGEQALSMLAYETGVQHFRSALEILDLETAPDDGLRGELLLRLGDSLWKMGDVAGARSAFEDVVTLSRRLGAGANVHAGRLMAHAALGYGYALHSHERWHQAEPYVQLYEEALAALEEGSSALRARLLAGLAVSRAYLGRTATAIEAADAAVALAERIDDRAALLDAIESRVLARLGPEHLAARIADAATIVRVAELAGDRERELRGRELLLWAMLERGDVAAADAEIDTYDRRAQSWRLPLSQWTALKLRSIRAQMNGEFDDARRFAEQALAAGQDGQIPLAELGFGWQILTIEMVSGTMSVWPDLPEHFVAQAMDQPGSLGRLALAAFYAEMDHRQRARQWFESLASADFADLTRDVSRPVYLSWLAVVCAYLGDAPRAALLYPLLVPYADTNVLMARALSCMGSAGRYLGLLAATMADRRAAERHFEDALSMNRRMGARAWLIRTQRDYAAMLMDRGSAGDRARARQLLTDALTTANAMGMSEAAEQIQRRLSEGAPIGSPVAGFESAGLSMREIEVLRLLSAGANNREIAATLVLSVRTVEHHLARIYAKINARGRADAAAYAVRHGLLTTEAPSP